MHTEYNQIGNHSGFDTPRPPPPNTLHMVYKKFTFFDLIGHFISYLDKTWERIRPGKFLTLNFILLKMHF